MPGRDVVVIGASAGGVEALIQFVAGLPADLRAAVFVVVHMPSNSKSQLPEILSRRGPLPAAHVRGGEKIAYGRIYVAPPDYHVIVREDRVELDHGPRENHVRPAIDPLFRSAARAHGQRVVGVVLSGTLDDGSTGMMIIKAYGGVCLVQDPDEALFGDMPRAALRHTAVNYVLPVGQIAEKIITLSREPVERRGGSVMQDEAEVAKQTIEQDITDQASDQRGGETTIYTCPDCGGVLWQLQAGEIGHFECHVGHTFWPENLLQLQSEQLETALWSCVRMLREKATLAHQLAARARDRGDEGSAQRGEERARLDERHMRVILDTLLAHPLSEVATPPAAIDPSGAVLPP